MNCAVSNKRGSRSVGEGDVIGVNSRRWQTERKQKKSRKQFDVFDHDRFSFNGYLRGSARDPNYQCNFCPACSIIWRETDLWVNFLPTRKYTINGHLIPRSKCYFMTIGLWKRQLFFGWHKLKVQANIESVIRRVTRRMLERKESLRWIVGSIDNDPCLLFRRSLQEVYWR